MLLIQEMEKLCRQLAPLGWSTLMQRHGLDLESDHLEAELQRPLPAIEPGKPAASLL